MSYMYSILIVAMNLVSQQTVCRHCNGQVQHCNLHDKYCNTCIIVHTSIN